MQDYKLVVRSLTVGNTVINPQTGQIITQNASEFMSYLNEQYLAQGYRIINVDTISTANDQFTRSYDLVKELEEKVKAK